MNNTKIKSLSMKFARNVCFGSIDNAALKCPVCGEIGLHQGEVRVFQRDTEDGPGTLAVINNGVVGSERLESDQIADRRDSLLISFWCENDCPTFVLSISQQKGLTFAHWVAAEDL
jgi:hypothetical protein